MNDDKCIVTLLGTAQDAGLPQLGCRCANCTRALHDERSSRAVVSLGLINPNAGTNYIIDATPEFKKQLITLHELSSRFITRGAQAGVGARVGGRASGKRSTNRSLGLDGIFLTHGHMGHYLGLNQLGKEAYSSSLLPVYATKPMKKFLSGNQPYKDLIRNRNLDIRSITPGKVCLTEENLKITPLQVEHRGEYSDTVGYFIQGPNKRLLYVPDMDVITSNVIEMIQKSDIVLVDGTFYDKTELEGRREPGSVPHPYMIETIQLLEPYVRRARIMFVHLNHTNPVLNPKSDEAKVLKSHGFGIAPEGWIVRI
jgi:pyrroloquinoline quinone biosynthesis protein B